ncbi:tetratricopeptide repeat protein [Effusibacillus pohliae]|uniref:tetratricopeptide repeat protein n=1 Tax=Effusibacillus pohliae TaxID=232270 RepID=UPI000369DCD1|nr:tetratricopeptide repeat protein [Effusibacillus pohliae]
MDRQQQKKRRRPDSNLIPFRLDAAFFFERAVRHLDRHNLQNALKYFRKAVEYEPDNPVNHCNLAGVLSEMGSFEESNRILENVLESIDPQMYECYFYMANNWANLGDYDKAEEYAARYLDLEPQGEFAQDAEEMLQILIEEFGGGEVLRQRLAEREAERREQDLPRKLLEQGKFMEAVAHLQKTIEQHPELTAPRNNLSLAYYYLGRLDKAVEIAREVLVIDPGNLHARCNLAVYLQHLERTDELAVLLEGLRKVYPLQFDQCYKLATTMGILGEHQVAHRLFLQMARWSEQPDAPLLHCVAASACNSGHYGLARRIWKDIQLLDPDGEVAPFYLRALEEAEAAGIEMRQVSYHYQIPFNEQVRRIQEQMRMGKPGNWRNDPLIRSSLFWALQHGELETKIQVIQTFALIADREVEQALREFVCRPNELEQLKLLAIYVLKHIGADGPFTDVPALNKDWKAILEKARAAVEAYADHLGDVTCRIWSDFLVQSLQQPPQIASLNTWAAGLAYFTLRLHGISVTQAAVAERFGVSPSSVSKIFRQIGQTLES